MILVVSNMYPSKEHPNYGVFVKNFYEQLSLVKKVQIIYLNKTNKKVNKLFYYLNFYRKVFMDYAFGNYEMVYVHYAGYNAPPLLLAKLFNKKSKLIVNVHGSDVIPEKKLEEKSNFFTKYLLKKADLIVVPSSYFEEVVKKKYGKDLPIWVSPSAGIDFRLFNNRKKRQTNKFFTIGYVSRIDKEKGWDNLLYAFQRLLRKHKDMRLIMVGDGAQNREANQLIKKLKLEKYVEKHNCLTQKELVDIYSSLDVFIFPSKGESLGLVGIEAMACGTPVIGSNLGGIKTYLKDNKNGFLVHPDDPQALAETIERYYELPFEYKEKLSEEAFETAKRYDSKHVNKQLLKKLSEINEMR